jgi:hypothetical protein
MLSPAAPGTDLPPQPPGVQVNLYNDRESDALQQEKQFDSNRLNILPFCSFTATSI